MSSHGHRVVLAVALAVSVSAPARSADEALLRKADVGALTPESFRSRMRIAAPGRPPLEIEVWRKGESRTLVRLLGPKEEGKYFLRLSERRIRQCLTALKDNDDEPTTRTADLFLGPLK